MAITIKSAMLDPAVQRLGICAALLNNEEASLDAIIGDAVPHDARFAACDGVLEGDHLAGVEGGVPVDGAESALAVVQQVANDLLRGGIVEGQFQRSLAAIPAFGPALGG
jgi:hypothetical protein